MGALEAAAHDKGVPASAKTLMVKIEWLHQQGLILRSQKEACDQVRWFGNDGAHDVEGVECSESEQLVELVELLFGGLYVSPARTATLQAARS